MHNRREFLKSTAAVAATASLGTVAAVPKSALASPTVTSPAETAVVALWRTLTDQQKAAMCFAWDHTTRERGLLRTHVSNNWQITAPVVRSDFYTREQQGIIHDIFRGVINPEWYNRFVRQQRDDTGGQAWGSQQSIALFGTPGEGRFEFVMTGRHMTLRADGNTEDHVAFGGPIFYGHAVQGTERADHPDNVFWPQARMANGLFNVLDERHQRQAVVAHRPAESAVAFQGRDGRFPGVSVRDLASDQKEHLARVLECLIEPFRTADQDEVRECLRVQGGLDACRLAFYADSDIGRDQVYDDWRLEGPSFVWYFRGNPHVHVWVNVASSHEVRLNAQG